MEDAFVSIYNRALNVLTVPGEDSWCVFFFLTSHGLHMPQWLRSEPGDRDKTPPVCRQGQTEVHPLASRAPGEKLNPKSIVLEPLCVCAHMSDCHWICFKV